MGSVLKCPDDRKNRVVAAPRRPNRSVWLDPVQTRAYTRSSTLTKRSNVLVSKSGCTSIRRPPGSTTASPQVASCCVGDFLAANATFSNRPAEETGLRLLFERRFFRWRSSVLKLKPRLWQNSLRRIPLLTNSATNRLSNRCVGQTLAMKSG